LAHNQRIPYRHSLAKSHHHSSDQVAVKLQLPPPRKDGRRKADSYCKPQSLCASVTVWYKLRSVTGSCRSSAEETVDMGGVGGNDTRSNRVHMQCVRPNSPRDHNGFWVDLCVCRRLCMLRCPCSTTRFNAATVRHWLDRLAVNVVYRR